MDVVSNNIFKSACKNFIILCLLPLIICEANKSIRCSQSLQSEVKCNVVDENKANIQCIDKVEGENNAYKYHICLESSKQDIYIKVLKNYGFDQYRLMINQQLLQAKGISGMFQNPKALFLQIKEYSSQILIQDQGRIKILISGTRKIKKYLTLELKSEKARSIDDVINKVIQGRKQIESQMALIKQLNDQLNKKLFQNIENFNKQNRSLKQKITQLSQQLNDQNKQISALTHALNAQTVKLNNLEQNSNSILGKTIQHLRVNGLRLGNRWLIHQGGTGSLQALVFRDLTTTNSGQDRRYAMYKGKYTDL